MKKTTLLLVSMSVFCAFDSYAQSFTGQAAEQKLQGAKWIEYSKESSRPTFVQFNPASANFRMAVSNPLEMMKEVLSLKQNDNLVSYKQEKDEIGFTHTRYQQVYKNIPVEGAEYLAHQKNGLLDCINGLFVTVGDVSVNPSLSESAALSKAVSFVGAKSYKWDNKEEIANLRAAFGDPTFNYDPKGALVIYAKNNEVSDKSNFRLAYKFNIYAQEPESRAYIFVDAQTGEILGRQELLHSADVEGTAHTKYSGTQKIMVTQKSTTNFVLQETGRGKGISTFNANNASEGSATYPSTDFVDTDNDWNNVNAKYDEAATDAHWATEMTYDYFFKVHNRNSVDNAGFKLINYVHCGTNWFNANWNGQFMRYGDGNGGKPLTAIDIGGHEMTHGVTSNSANLVYQNESGALNESFSDIFGNMVEYYAKPATASWAMGEAIGAIRNMQNPNQYNNPDTYKGTYWATGTADQGGVHTNSGVQNKWFYILSIGEKGTNDVGTAFDVTGITREKAAKIAFRNLTSYLTSSSNYAAARTNSLKAATDLYGDCSPEFIATGDAWNAVGVGDKITGCQVAPVVDFFADKTTSCDGTIKFTDKSSSSPTSWAWDFGDGQTSTTQNPSHTYAAGGSYTVKLKATNAFGNDEEVKTSYVTINLLTAPTGTGAERCGPGTVNLSASAASGNLNWYTTQTGGTSVYTGPSYAANLTATTTYYVETSTSSPAQKVGPADNTALTGTLFIANADHGLVFDVLAPCTLKSVKVYAGAAGDRTIEVLDKVGGTPFLTKVVTIPAGESRVTLDFDLPVGTQYFIKVSGTLIDLFRSNSGNAAYPYTLANLVSITETDVETSSPKFYYFFYDWEVQTTGCTSSRTPVIGVVNPEVAKPVITEDSQKVLSTTTGSGLSYQWFFNGVVINGATASTYKPTQDGNYTVKVTGAASCFATSDTYQFKASAIGTNTLDATVHIYPNPVSESIFVEAPLSGNNVINIYVYSVIGKLIYQETYTNSGQAHQINLGSIDANGIYFIKLQSGSESVTRKFNLNR